ncbi:MAG: CvpA family protein [Firmicutes bacterium]|nr:CvpA family protein [Bacillota bacterium]
MAPWIDIAAVIIIAVIAIIGVSRGFLRSLLSLFGTLVTLALSIWLAKPVAGLINGWFGLNEVFADWIAPVVENAFPDAGYPSAFGILLQTIFGLRDAGQTLGEYVDMITAHLGELLSIIATVIILYILIKIAVWLLSMLFNAITKNRVVNGLDRLLGLALGLVKGILFVAVIFGAIYLLSTVIGSLYDFINPLLDASSVSNWFFNLIAQFIDDVLLPYFLSL